MDKQQTPQPSAQSDDQVKKGKKSYQTPVLKEHGHAKDVTLQTFFGTFSPPAD